MSFLPVLPAVIGVFFALWLVRFLWRRRRLYLLSSKVPGPRNYPLIGMAHRLLGKNDEVFKAFLEIFADYPDLCKCWFGPDLFYFVTKPEYLEKILNHPGAISKSFAYDPMRSFMGSDGLFIGKSAKWKVARKYLAPSFNQKNLNTFVSCFNDQFSTLLEILKENPKNEEVVDIDEYVSNYVVDVISETLFNCDIKAQERKLPIGRLLNDILAISMEETTRPWYHLDVIFKLTNLYKEKTKLIDEITAFTSEIFDLAKNGSHFDEDFEDESTTKPKSLIQALFTRKSKEPQFTDENILTEINTFFAAAMDTSTITICFTLVLLGMHPEIQAKVHSEVSEIMEGRDDKTIKVEDLQRLKYTELVIKESLRIFPPAAVISREIESDLILDDIVLPQGAHLLIGFYSVHRDARYWPDPLKFDPDRFLPEEMSKRHPYTWNAFSGGPRNCIGYRYGMMMLKVVMAEIMMNFEISTGYRSVAEVEVKLDALLRPRNGYKVFMNPRE